MIKILIILALAVTSYSQSYKSVGTSNDNPSGTSLIYFVDEESIYKKGNDVTFKGFLAAYSQQGEQISLDKEHYLYSSFSANCQTYKWSETERKGQWGDIKIEDKPKKTQTATKGTIIFTTIEIVCKEKGLRA